MSKGEHSGRVHSGVLVGTKASHDDSMTMRLSKSSGDDGMAMCLLVRLSISQDDIIVIVSQ